jgi:hypothetical protein
MALYRSKGRRDSKEDFVRVSKLVASPAGEFHHPETPDPSERPWRSIWDPGRRVSGWRKLGRGPHEGVSCASRYSTEGLKGPRGLECPDGKPPTFGWGVKPKGEGAPDQEEGDGE